ncbi:DUF4214 domain-containing protein [Paracidovorax citrulli]
MTTKTAVLNADGTMTFYGYLPSSEGNVVTETVWSAEQVGWAQLAIQDWVSRDFPVASFGPQYVLASTLAVANGYVTASALQAWALKHNTQITGIFEGEPANGVPQRDQSLTSGLNDRELTSEAGVPTLAEAAAKAALDGQDGGSSDIPGPTPIPGNDAADNIVQGAYIAYYGRPADAEGLEYWSSRLEQEGMSFAPIINAFGNSQESRDLYGGSSIEDQITAIYRQQFNRDPDSVGMAYWTKEISTGKVSAAAAAIEIFNGATGSDKQTINNKLVVADTFTDAQEISAALRALYAGETAVINARSYLSAVTDDASLAIKIAGIHDLVASDIRGNLADEFASIGIDITLVGASMAADEFFV